MVYIEDEGDGEGVTSRLVGVPAVGFSEQLGILNAFHVCCTSQELVSNFILHRENFWANINVCMGDANNGLACVCVWVGGEWVRGGMWC